MYIQLRNILQHHVWETESKDINQGNLEEMQNKT